MASEAANAGKVILSHADAATREQCEDTVAHLNRALEQIRCDRRIDPEKDILQRNLTDLTKEDLEEVSKCGYRLESYRKMDLENEQSFDSLFSWKRRLPRRLWNGRSPGCLPTSPVGKYSGSRVS